MARGKQQHSKASFGEDIKPYMRACKRLSGGASWIVCLVSMTVGKELIKISMLIGLR